MALLLKAEELTGIISIQEAIDAVESGFRDQAKHPQFSLPRYRMMAGDRRINVHSGGCVDLRVAGTFIHYERHRYTKQDQSYAAAGKRVYMAYDSETAATPRRELDDKVLAHADVIVATLRQQGIYDEQGDFVEPIGKGLLRWDDIEDLSSLLSGNVPGRTGAKQITLFKQNSDQGVGFMALARLAHDKTRSAGIGMEI